MKNLTFKSNSREKFYLLLQQTATSGDAYAGRQNNHAHVVTFPKGVKSPKVHVSRGRRNRLSERSRTNLKPGNNGRFIERDHQGPQFSIQRSFLSSKKCSKD
jgi:hypothetical protein